ncbi:hypothetical protein [Rhizobium sp. Leaf262]|uniref:hypothetical protein n=1 Tax=Rhizobium sp. Leaf262 TaxID=1736312 RepID=UPI0007149F97|nr:hypothetical protein [Rhizobium sp. Leaf262]KQO75295.1 hypothetical protein ASF29_12845 [Rhizobium sp. Leaf262]
MSMESKERKRRRTCVDELRRDLARRRERRTDPATKTLLQLLTLLSAALALMQPAEPAFDIAPRSRRRTRYDPPQGYGLGRDAWARERGLEPQPDSVLATSETPVARLRPALKSWRRLVRELDSPSPRRRESARAALEHRLPSLCHDWLRRQVASEDRSQLRMLGVGVGPAELVQRAMMAARVESANEPEVLPSLAPAMELDVEDEDNADPGLGKR